MDIDLSRPRILVAHASGLRREMISTHLLHAGFDCLEASDGPSAWRQFQRSRPDLVLSSAALPGLNGVELLVRVRGVSTIPFLLEIDAGDVTSAVAAVREGADEVIQDCAPVEDFSRRSRRILAATPGSSAERFILERLPGRSPAMTQLRRKLVALSGLRVPILFRGEPGSGRTFAGRVLASSAGVDGGSFRAIGPDAPPSPAAELGSGTVVFLQNVDRFDRSQQARWASAIRDATPRGREPRLMASTEMDLEPLASAGEFDTELASLLTRFPVDVPPLRDYLSDLRVIVERIGSEAAEKIGRPRALFTPQAIALLQRHQWPGNVRQLRIAVERLVAFSTDGAVTKRTADEVLSDGGTTVDSLRMRTDRKQRLELMEALREADGNLAEVARRLGMSRGAIIYRARKFGLLPEPRRRRRERPPSPGPS